jgi:hypothetical protein
MFYQLQRQHTTKLTLLQHKESQKMYAYSNNVGPAIALI